MGVISEFISRQLLEPLLRTTDDNGMKHRKYVVAGWLSSSLSNLFFGLGLIAYRESPAARTMLILCLSYAVFGTFLYVVLRLRRRCELWFVILSWLYLSQGAVLQCSWFHNKALQMSAIQSVLTTSWVVARPPKWLLFIVTFIAVIQVMIFIAGEHYDFGLFTFLPGNQYLEIPIFMSVLASGLLVFWLLMAVGTVFVIVDMLAHEENKSDMTIKVAKAAALGLSLYDIDPVKEMLNRYEESEDSDIEMKNIIMSICENMEKYKSYLPNWLINTEENDFVFESEDDEDSQITPAAKQAQLELELNSGSPSSSQTPRTLSSVKSRSKRDLENFRNAIFNVFESEPSSEVRVFSPSRQSLKTRTSASQSGVVFKMSESGVSSTTGDNSQGSVVTALNSNPLGGNLEGLEITDVDGSDGLPTPLQRFVSRGGISPANHFFGKITFASIDFDLSGADEGAKIQVSVNHFVETLTDLVSATHGALHSISGDTAQLSWNAVERVAQSENKALKVVNLLRENDRFAMSKVQASGAISTGDAKCFDAGRKVHSTVVSPAGWKEAHGEMRQIAQKYGSFVCDAATFEQAKYHHELAAVDYVELSSTKPQNLSQSPAGAPRSLALAATVIYEVVTSGENSKEHDHLKKKQDSEWMYQLQETENASTASKISKVLDSLIFPSTPIRNSGALQVTPPAPVAKIGDVVIEANEKLQQIFCENSSFFKVNSLCARLVAKVHRLSQNESGDPINSPQPLKQSWLSVLREEL